MNDFLLNKKLISWQAQFFQQSGRSYWSVFLEYESVQKQKEIPKLNLTPEQEILFQKLREWRKEQAEKQGAPVYVISNNQVLSEMVTRQIKSLEDLKQIKGFGDKKVADYGKEILHIITTFNQST